MPDRAPYVQNNIYSKYLNTVHGFVQSVTYTGLLIVFVIGGNVFMNYFQCKTMIKIVKSDKSLIVAYNT